MTWRKEFWDGLRRPLLVVGCTFLAFMLSVGTLALLLGTWPPFMAVESKSMQHSDNSSAIGVVDTGDVVVVSSSLVNGKVRTYLGSLQDDYRSFGEYGDVVIYQAPEDDIPIVHRAICELVYNSTAEGFDIPELAKVPASMWSVPAGDREWHGLSEWIELFDIGYANVTVHIDLHSLYVSMQDDPHGGLITMGDNNWKEINDQRYGIVDQGSLVQEPIRWSWVIGKVVGEVPWIGTIRLWMTGTAPPYMPANSVILLLATVGALAALPAVLWVSAQTLERRRYR
ncbi:MAG: hypothetical protein SA339_12230 [Methanomassiliicoccus sp.]|nr:hypothetical protein [Methanomassiliicoccus sp.]